MGTDVQTVPETQGQEGEKSSLKNSFNASGKPKSLTVNSRWARLKAYLGRHKWLAALFLMVLIALGYLGYTEILQISGRVAKAAKPGEAQSNLSVTKAPSPLTGLSVPLAEAHRYPVATMIENTPDARPQSGLSKAGLVYEAFAEGGITRFLAVFVDGDTAGDIGPVRSARPYYVDWADEFHAIYVHAGGSPGALALIPSTSVIDMNGLLGGIDTAFRRDPSRQAPHNLYTTLDKVRAKAQSLGHDLSKPSYPTFLYRDDTPEAQRPQSAEIDVNWGGLYAVKWVYDKATDSYDRFIAGQPSVDKVNSKQVTSRNIIIQTVPQSLITADPKHRLDIGTVGSGQMQYCAEGSCVDGTWKKGQTGKTRFYDANGAEIKLVRGNTWIEAVPSWVVVSD